MDEREIYKNRDIMLAEIHSDMKYIRQGVEEGKADLKSHEAKDEKFQEKIHEKIGWGIKIAIAVLIIVAANGGLSAIKTLFTT